MIRSVAPLIVVAAVVTGCRGLAPGASGPVDAGQNASQGLAASGPAVTASPSPSTGSDDEQCPLGFGIAEHQYPGLREFARLSDGVAVAEVVTVSEPTYSTESGNRPSCDYIDDAEAVFTIGRMVELRVVTPVAGRGRSGEIVRYFFPGGSIGQDATPGHHFGVQVPQVGDRMLVLLMDEPFDADPGDGVLEVDVLELFEIANGRVRTPDANEQVTVENVGDVVRDAVRSPSPGG